jgi:thiamine pyrophosphate-dependent acetolactate synthase large subunit-like protein
MTDQRMNHKDCMKALARHVDDGDIVLPVYSSAFEWLEAHPSALNYTAHGAMGLASSHGLGLALGRPDKRVIVLDGDGSLLMNIGTLVTAAAAAPKNFFHFVCENGTYEANGGHPTPNRGHVSFAGLARAAGYRSVHEFSDLKNFEQQIGAILAEQGPVFVHLKIERCGPQERDYNRLHGVEARQAFKDAIRSA